MSTELFAAYVAACTVLVFVPGPTLLLVISYSLSHGRRAAAPTIAGVMAGDVVALTLAFLGLGALLESSATLFTAMKFLGAIYLAYLGIQMWRSKTSAREVGGAWAPSDHWSMARDAFTVTVLNPKSGIFFVAFLPQFMNPSAPLWPQIVALGGTFLLLAFVSCLVYAILASAFRSAVSSPSMGTAVNRVGGAALFGASVLTFAMKRAG